MPARPAVALNTTERGHAQSLSLSLSLLGMVCSSSAHAACVDGTTASCAGPGTSDICVLDTTVGTDDTVDCHLDANGSSRPAVVNVVTNSGAVEVFGIDANGDDFCCMLSPSNAYDTVVVVTGSTYGDAITLNYYDGSGYIDLEPLFSRAMRVSVVGANGDDDIYGSYYVGGDYEEKLQGGADDDTIRGNDGNDILDGGDGDDSLHGNEGDDLLIGGSGDDTLYGNEDDDVIYGDGRTPYVYPGRDIIQGEGGNDTICSGGTVSGVEHLEGGAGNDKVWATPDPVSPYLTGPSANIYGNSHTTGDTCDNNPGTAHPWSDCETLTTSDPGCW